MAAAAAPRVPAFLHASFDAPAWGGAATSAYAWFERRQRDGAAVHFVNLVTDAVATALRDTLGPDFDNPRRLANVHTCRLVDPWWRPLEPLAALVARIRPDVVVAHGSIAAGMMRMAAPRLPLIFMTTGAQQVKRLVSDGSVRDFADFARLAARGVGFTLPREEKEYQAVAGSDLILVHSPHVRVVYEHLFSGHMGKVYARLVSVADAVYDEAAPFAGLARPFAERDVDVVFIASDWRRAEKNYPLVRRLAAECRDLRLALVGRADADDAPLQRHGVLSRADVFALLGRAKAIVCPSLFDAAPGVLFEADALGANVVASANCGNWQLCHPELLARTADDFVGCIRRAVQQRLPANPTPFLGGYAEFVDTVETFAGGERADVLT
jgi:glycosyltransferase involved in cell wall biosynthesis